jgi:hypothetical protein
MKNILKIMIVAILMALNINAADAAAGAKLKKISLPTAGTEDIIVWEEDDEIAYHVPIPNGRADFVARPDQQLVSIRLVIDDETKYQWKCYYSDKGDILLNSLEGDGLENGLENKVAIDKEKWLKFFKEKIALKPFIIRRQFVGLTEIEGSREYTLVGYDYPHKCIVLKPEGALSMMMVRTIKEDDVLFQFPRDGTRFLLGKKMGKFFPIQRTTTGGFVVSIKDDVSLKDQKSLE